MTRIQASPNPHLQKLGSSQFQPDEERLSVLVSAGVPIGKVTSRKHSTLK